MRNRDAVKCGCGPDCICTAETIRPASRQTALWVVTVLAVLIAAGSLFSGFNTNRQLTKAKAIAASQAGAISTLTSSLAAVQANQAGAIESDSLNNTKFLAAVARVRNEAVAARTEADSLATLLAATENRVAAVETAQATVITTPQVAEMVSQAVAPVAMAQQASAAVDSADTAKLRASLDVQRQLINNVEKRTSKTGLQRIWEAIITAMAVTGVVR